MRIGKQWKTRRWINSWNFVSILDCCQKFENWKFYENCRTWQHGGAPRSHFANFGNYCTKTRRGQLMVKYAIKRIFFRVIEVRAWSSVYERLIAPKARNDDARFKEVSIIAISFMECNFPSLLLWQLERGLWWGTCQSERIQTKINFFFPFFPRVGRAHISFYYLLWIKRGNIPQRYLENPRHSNLI
jgi:hypothetical protein